MPDSLVLVLSNSQDATADYLCGRLGRAGVRHLRFDTDRSLDAIQLECADPDLTLTLSGKSIRPDDIHAIIYRRPKPFDPTVAGDEHQRRHAAEEWAEAVEGILAHVPANRWINHPTHNFNASHKIHQLTCARSCGLVVPPWIVTTVAETAKSFFDANAAGIIAKPLASGYIERASPTSDTLIYTCAVDSSHTALFDRLPACPVLFQARVEKEADVRLVAVDDHMIAVSMIAEDPDGRQRLDIRRNNMQDVRYCTTDIPSCVAGGVRRLLSGYGLRFAAIDFAIDVDGQWTFFEVNPNGQWAWLDLADAADIGQLFIDAIG